MRWMFRADMRFVLLLCCLTLAAEAHGVDDEWIDPYDMINYDASTKTMRKAKEPVFQPSAGREPTEESRHEELTSCSQRVSLLQRQVDDHKKKLMHISQQPTCYPVFKRFLTRVLKEVHRVGLPDGSTEVLYDSKIRLTKQAVTELQSLLEGEDSCKTGAVDHAISQLLVDLRPHDYEAWKWRFEDTFGVELDVIFKISLFIMVMNVIICTQLWSTVSWFLQFRRLFVISFFVSIVWNWFYLYKIAFAEHQNNIVKMDSVNQKCTGMRKIDWSDSLKEWFRSTWTLQDDPCKTYYEVLMVNPILLVPPTKAISVTLTTFITEPLKHIGQGISDFLRALLKDLPITLQIPVLLTIVLAIVVCMYGGVNAAFRYGITAPLRRRRRDPPPPELRQARPRPQRIADRPHPAESDEEPPRPRANEGRVNRHHVRHRRNKAREEVETLRSVNPDYSENEIDGEQQSESEQSEHQLSAIESDTQAESDSPNQPETQEEWTGAGAARDVTDVETKTKKSQSNTRHTKTEPLKKKAGGDGPESRSPPSRRQPSQRKKSDGVQNLEGPAGDVPSAAPPAAVETIPVQETSLQP